MKNSIRLLVTNMILAFIIPLSPANAGGAGLLAKHFSKENVKVISGVKSPGELFAPKERLVVLWAEWCEFCARELKNLQESQVEMTSCRDQVIALSLDDQKEGAIRAARKRGYTFPVYYHGSRRESLKALGLSVIPAVLRVSPSGEIIEVGVGTTRCREMFETFKALHC